MALFRELLTEGKLGDARLGMRPEIVEQSLGTPDDRSVKSRPVAILKFGSVELAFKHIPDTNDSRLVSIAVYFHDRKRTLPPGLGFRIATPRRRRPRLSSGSFSARQRRRSNSG